MGEEQVWSKRNNQSALLSTTFLSIYATNLVFLTVLSNPQTFYQGVYTIPLTVRSVYVSQTVWLSKYCIRVARQFTEFRCLDILFGCPNCFAGQTFYCTTYNSLDNWSVCVAVLCVFEVVQFPQGSDNLSNHAPSNWIGILSHCLSCTPMAGFTKLQLILD